MLQSPSFLLKVQLTKVWKEGGIHVHVPQVLVVNRVGGRKGVQCIVAC